MRLVHFALPALSLALAGCGSLPWLDRGPAPTPTAPAAAMQHFNCYGPNNGLLAGAFSVRPGGTANFNGQEGTWQYDGQVFTFSSELSVASATLDPATGALAAVLRPGHGVQQAEDDRLTCRPLT